MVTEAGTSVTLKTLLKFFTCLEKHPALGFDHDPTLKFADGMLATATTCENLLWLPLGPVVYPEFRAAMTMSLIGHRGFGTP